MNFSKPTVGQLWLQNTGTHLPAFTKCVESCLPDYPDSVEGDELYKRYVECRCEMDAPPLDFDHFCFALGMSWATYRTIIITSREPLIIALAPEAA